MVKKFKAHILKKPNGVGRVPYTDLYAIEPGSLVITRKQVEQLERAIRKTPVGKGVKLSRPLIEKLRAHWTRGGTPLDKETKKNIHSNNGKKHDDRHG